MERILSISIDPTFAEAQDAPSDTLKRHRNYVRALRERRPGAELTVLTCVPRPGPRPFSPCEGLKIIPLHPPLRALFGVWAFREGLRQGPFDIITSQTPFDDGLAAFALARVLGARYLCQLHVDLPASAVLLLRHADAVRVVSERLHDEVRRRVPRRCPVYRIPVPVGLRAPSNGEGRELLFVGRLVPEKNLPMLLRVYERILRERPDAVLTIVGDGPERPRIQRAAERLGVRLAGAVPYDRLDEHYQRAALLILPSRQESYGRVILEAALHGVPTVATPTGGACELIEEGRTGFLAATESAMSARILRLLEDPALRLRVGQAARRAAHRRGATPELSSALAGMYEEVSRLPRMVRT